MGIFVQRSFGGLLGIKTSLHEQSCVSFCQLYQRLPTQNGCFQGEIGAVFSQKQEDGWFHLVAFGSWVLTTHEKNYHSTKLEFLALKWAITEYFKEYLSYQPFLVKTDNNSLTYIMTTLNLDTTGHQWVGALAKYNFWLE